MAGSRTATIPQSLHLLYYLATAQWLLGEADAFEYSVARIVS